MSWGITMIIIGVIAVGVYGGVFMMHDSLEIEVSEGLVMQILQIILAIGIILLVAGGALTAIQLRSK